MEPDPQTSETPFAKTFFWLVIFLLIVGGVVWYGNKQNEEPSVIKIGALLPLTGKFASFGEDMRNGLTLALEDIKENNGATIEIVFEDSAADPKIAVPGARKLIDFEKTAIVIAGPGSSGNLAVAPIMEESKTVFLAISSTPKLNTAGQYIFKVNSDVEPEVEKAIGYMIEHGFQKAAVLYDTSSDTTTTGRNFFEKQFPEVEGRLAVIEGVDGRSVTDFRTSLAKIKAALPDALYLMVGSEKLAGMAVKQAREIGFMKPIVSWSGAKGEEFLRGAGIEAEGTVLTDVPFSCSEEAVLVTEYCRRYTEKFNGREPQHFGAEAYDLIIILNSLLQGNDKNTVLSPDGLKKVVMEGFTDKRYKGVSGTFSFDKEGNIFNKDFVFRVVKDGKFVEMK